MMSKRALSSRVVWALLGAATLATGCGGGFFIDTNGTTTTTSSSGDYVYVVNQTTNTLSEFVVGNATLTAITGSPISLTSGLAAASVAVTRPNTFVYVGGNGAISCYSVGSSGALSAVTGGGAGATANFVSLETSPDGKWLLALDSTTQTVYVYAINTSTGALILNATTTFAAPGAGTAAQRSIRISPSAAFVAIALGPAGDVVFTFNTTTGVLTQSATISLASGFSDNAVQFDSTSSKLYVARGGPTTGTAGVSTYSVSSSGALTQTQALIASGNAPFALLLDSAGSYLYAANRSDATVSGYSTSGGTLAALPSSPYPSGTSVIALAEDNSKKYLIAAASGGSPDLTLYGFDALTAGKLNAVATSASGSDPAGSVALATTH
jgi:6-phosphogluconolactonase